MLKDYVFFDLESETNITRSGSPNPINPKDPAGYAIR